MLKGKEHAQKGFLSSCNFNLLLNHSCIATNVLFFTTIFTVKNSEMGHYTKEIWIWIYVQQSKLKRIWLPNCQIIIFHTWVFLVSFRYEEYELIKQINHHQLWIPRRDTDPINSGKLTFIFILVEPNDAFKVLFTGSTCLASTSPLRIVHTERLHYCQRNIDGRHLWSFWQALWRTE